MTVGPEVDDLEDVMIEVFDFPTFFDSGCLGRDS